MRTATGVSAPVLPTLTINIFYGGDLFAGSEFKGDGPTWRPGDSAEPVLQRDMVYFDDSTVDLIGDFIPDAFDIFIVMNDLIDAPTEFC